MSHETNEDDIIDEVDIDTELQDYRFKMINHMPIKDATQSEICRQLGIPEVSHQWDIVDLEEKKLIRVRYFYNIGSDVHKYLTAKSEVPNNSHMYIIGAGKVSGKWFNKNRGAIGESKDTKYLLERQMIISSQGINDNLYLAPVEIETLFPSTQLKDELAKWEEDLMKDQYERYTEKELYTQENPPKTITRSDFLNNLKPIVN